MKKILAIGLFLVGLSFFGSCNPDSIADQQYDETEATGHGEVGDPKDQDDEDEVGG